MTFAELKKRFVDSEKERLRAENADLKAALTRVCGHRNTLLTGDGKMRCEDCGLVEVDNFFQNPGGS